jgi:ABC-2 type transport system permease protein
MRAALLVAWREYAENTKTKGFWIGIFLFPLIILGSVTIPAVLEKKATPERYFVLLDQSRQFEKVVESALERAHQRRLLRALTEYAAKHAGKPDAKAGPLKLDAADFALADRQQLESFLDEFAENNPEALEAFTGKGGSAFFLTQIRPFLRTNAPPFVEPPRRFHRVDLPAGIQAEADIDIIGQALKPYLRRGTKVDAGGRQVELHAAILIPADLEQHVVRPASGPALPLRSKRGVAYWSGNLADTALRDEVQRAINTEVRRREYGTRGLDVAAIRQVERTYAPFLDLNPTKEAGQETVNMADVIRQWAPSGFVYLLWVAIFSIVQMLLGNTIEEKSNKIIEVLLSSVTPGELMTGKLAGIAAVGLTMVGTWVASLLGVLYWKAGPQFEFGQQLFAVIRTSNLLPAFLFYFLFGYLMYAAVFMAIGSVCNTLKDAQNFMGVATLLLMVPLLTMVFIPKDPNGTLATVLSWIPIYTPFVMMNRATADPPWFDVAGTMVLMVASSALALWLSAKVFRIGILRTGQPPRLIELLRWLRRGGG